MIWPAEMNIARLLSYRGFQQNGHGSCWIDTTVYVLTRDPVVKQHVIKTLSSVTEHKYQAFIKAFLNYHQKFEQSNNQEKPNVLLQLQKTIRNINIEVHENGYGDFFQLIHKLCELANISTEEHKISNAKYELAFGFFDISKTLKEDFITMSLDVTHQERDILGAHVIGFYKQPGSFELYDNQAYLYDKEENKEYQKNFDKHTSYIKFQETEIKQVLETLELTQPSIVFSLKRK